MGPTVLVDASVYVFRGWFSIKPALTDPTGRPANAVYGFGQWLGRMLTELAPERAAVAFDESLTSSFRNEFFPAYKANREEAPAELTSQFRLCRRLAEAAGLACLSSPVYEADDLLATLAVREHDAGRNLLVLSRDKDLAQLLAPGDEMHDFPAGRRVGFDSVADVFGAPAPLIPDYLGLVGDKVDNIPGVPGVGAKTAALLLARWPGLEAIYADLEDVAALGVRGAPLLRARLAEHRTLAFLSRRLATLEKAVPLDPAPDLARRAPDAPALAELAAELGFSTRWLAPFGAGAAA